MNRRLGFSLFAAVFLLMLLAGCAGGATGEVQTVVVTEIVEMAGEEVVVTEIVEVEVEAGNRGSGSASDGFFDATEEPMEEYDAPEIAEGEDSGFVAVPPAESGGSGGGDAASEPDSSIAGSDEDRSADAPPVAVEESPASDVEFTPPDQQFLPLTAGEIDDNENFGAYIQYRLDFHRFMDILVEDLDVSERHIIAVYNEDGLPVLDAEVSIYEDQRLITVLRTPADGVVYFFPRAYSRYDVDNDYQIVVEKDQASVDFDLSAQGEDTLTEVELDVSRTRPPVQLDVLFLIDSTGSMGDEIDELKDNILSISAQIEALPSEPDVRFGMVTYRDRGDRYVTRITDFTGDIQRFQAELLDVDAAGGQDAPESLNEALHDAVNNVDWRNDETVRLVFLVADAPPHLDYPQDYSYAQELAIAVEEGITIHPIASRLCRDRDDCRDDLGLFQEQAEYIFRQMAQFTGGHFIFLTYEDTPRSSGESGSEVHVPEDEYSVEDLDALVVRLVQDTLATLMGDQQ